MGCSNELCPEPRCCSTWLVLNYCADNGTLSDFVSSVKSWLDLSLKRSSMVEHGSSYGDSEPGGASTKVPRIFVLTPQVSAVMKLNFVNFS